MLPDINLFHLTLPLALLLVGDWMTPTPSHRAHCSIYILHLSYFPFIIFIILLDLVSNIWSQLTYLKIIPSYMLVLSCFAWNQLSSSYSPHPFPGPTHSAGEGGWWAMMMIMAGGCGGTHNLDHIYIYIYIYIWLLCGSKIPLFSVWCLREKFHWKIDHDYIPFVRRLVDVTHYWRNRFFWNTRSIESKCVFFF